MSEINEWIEQNGKIYNQDGEVAVIISPGYGAGWSSWNKDYIQECLFDPDCVKLILSKKLDQLQALAETKWEDGFWSGAEDCVIEWIPKGIVFKVAEYDGYENIEFQDSQDWSVA